MSAPVTGKKALQTGILDVDALVSKPNQLIEAKYKLPIIEQKLVHLVMSQLDRHTSEFLTYEFKASEVAEAFGINRELGGSFYQTMRDTTVRLMQRVVQVWEPEEKKSKKGEPKYAWKAYHWVEWAQLSSDGTLQLRISPDMMSKLLHMKGNFTQMTCRVIFRMNSAYSVRLYEILKAAEFNKKHDVMSCWSRSYTLFELATIMSLTEKCYWKDAEKPNYGNINNRVLRPAIEEINQKSDIYVWVHEKKVSRGRVVGLTFHCSSGDMKPALDDLGRCIQEVNTLLPQCSAETQALYHAFLRKLAITPELPFEGVEGEGDDDEIMRLFFQHKDSLMILEVMRKEASSFSEKGEG